MKWIMVMGAVLALSPAAFGAATFTLTESGGSATAVDAQPGDTISVDLHMTAASAAKVFSLGLLQSNTGIFDVSARTWNSGGAPVDDPTFVSSVTSLDSPTSDAGATAQTTFPAGPSVVETFDLDINGGAANGVYTITMVGPGQAGMIYVQYADGTSGDSMAGYDYGSDVTLGTFQVTVPEPASMLLLAGALPFLRRRRSA